MQAHVEYETDNRHYAHVDCPGHADYVKVIAWIMVKTPTAHYVVGGWVRWAGSGRKAGQQNSWSLS